MTDKLREALEKTLAAIKQQVSWAGPTNFADTVAYIEAALQEPQQEPPNHLQVGPYKISALANGTFWIGHNSGEGMEVRSRAFCDLIAMFYEKEF